MPDRHERPASGQAAPQDWAGIARRLRLEDSACRRLSALADSNGTDFLHELIASGMRREELVFRAVAADLGVGYAGVVDARRMVIEEQDALMLLSSPHGPFVAKMFEPDWRMSHVVVPENPGVLRRVLRRRPGVRARLCVTSRSLFRRALGERAAPGLVRTAVNGLADAYPEFSARNVASAWQGVVLGAALVGVPVAITFDPEFAYGTLHILVSFFFLSCVGLRFAALLSAVGPAPPRISPCSAADMPVYSVIVALYREAAVVPDLVAALDRLVWPRSKLEIKLACEADDAETLSALAGQTLPPHVEVVHVPAVGPRTKPKALAYALPLTRGELVVLFDAEDQPHPLQLVEAWQRFANGPPELACLQAPLEIGNQDQGIMARMFAFEYSGLFRGLLPWLARRRALLPLGGTSNHLRRQVLEEVGGWDPYNVTEDADLGLRLARFGYRTEMIFCPTYEDGPADFRVWLPQRTRWFKGWLQTWLIHMRQPRRLLVELGPGSFMLVQILFAGMLVSAFFHPFLLATGIFLALSLAVHGQLGTLQSAMFAVDVVNIACGYLAFILLGWQTARGSERLSFWKIVLFTPIYWMMLSVAAWRSVFQLWRRPHMWEKTPHRPARRRHFGAAPGGSAT